MKHDSHDKRRDRANTDAALMELEVRVDELVAMCERLISENRSLRANHAVLMEERARLQERADTARNRLDATIARLRSMELD